MEDYYDILGVKPDASIEEIKRRYRFLAMAYHPDRFPDPMMRENAEAEMKRINTAYAVLSNPRQRAEYDRKRKVESQSRVSTSVEEDAQPQDTRSDEPSGDEFQYLYYLMNKWQFLAETILKKPNKEISESLQEIFQVLYVSFPVESERQEIFSLVITFILSHIALGAESATEGIDPRFKREQLENVLLKMLIVKFSLTGKDSLWYHQVQKHSIDHITKLLLKIGFIAQKEGANRARVSKNAEEKTENKGNENRSKDFNTPIQEPHLGFCNACGEYGYVKNATFRKNIGMIFARRYHKVEGELCGRCIERYFWSFTAATLFLGWWGTISFLVSPFILLANIFEYLNALPFVIRHVRGWARINLGSKIIAILGFIFLFQIIDLVLIPPSPPHVTTKDNNSWILATPGSSSFKTGFSTEIITPTFTLEPSSTPTIRPTPTTRRSSPSKSKFFLGAPANCVSWSEISTKDKNQFVCVYGTVKNFYWDQEGNNHITFSSSVNAVRFICHECYFPELKVGDCVFASGSVLVTDGVPYIVIDELYRCPY